MCADIVMFIGFVFLGLLHGLICGIRSRSCIRNVLSQERCRISPSHFLAECPRKRLNQDSFVLVYFALFAFYRAMHFSAKRGIAIACRLSVRLSVTLVNCDHIGWNSSEIISPSVSLVCSLFATQISRVYSKGNTTKFSPK